MLEILMKKLKGLKFKLVVAPVGSRSINVGYAVTPGISVRSKRNKRTSSSTSAQSPSRKKSQQSIVSPGSVVQGESVDNSDIGPCTPSPSRDFTRNRKASSTVQGTDLNTALSVVTDWAKEVSRILPTLNWSLIGKFAFGIQTSRLVKNITLKVNYTFCLQTGYCQNVDGSVDYSKPNHLMPYPNDCIKRLTRSYSTNVLHCLEVLQNGLDRGIVGDSRSANDANASNFRPSLLHSPNSDSKNFFNNIQPTPLSQMSPMAIIPPTPQTHPGERKRSGSWSKNKLNNHDSDDYNDQLKKIDFIYAKHLVSVKGDKLGFPVCDVNNDLIGFFRESDVGEPRFFPISNMAGLDVNQKNEVNKVVEEAVNQRNDAVHRLKDYGTLASLFDHVMVYDWSREFSQHA